MFRKALIALAAVAALGAGASAASAKTHINIDFGIGGFGPGYGDGPYIDGVDPGFYPDDAYDCGYQIKLKKVWIAPGHAIFVKKKVWVCG